MTRFLADGKGVDAGFTAHPSAVVATEYQNITKPLSIAFGGMFFSFPILPMPVFCLQFLVRAILTFWKQNSMQPTPQPNEQQPKQFSKAKMPPIKLPSTHKPNMVSLYEQI